MYLSIRWVILFIYIHHCYLHFRSVVFLQFNQLANYFHALEIKHKSKIKCVNHHPLELFPRPEGAPASQGKQQPFSLLCGEQEEMRGTLEDPVRVKSKEFEYLGSKLLLAGNKNVDLL